MQINTSYSVNVRLFCQSSRRSLAFQKQPDARKVPEAWVCLCLTIQLVWHQLMLRTEVTGERKQFQADILCHLNQRVENHNNRDLRLFLHHEVIYLRIFEPFMVLALFCMAPTSGDSSSTSHISVSCQLSCSATLPHGKQLKRNKQ